MFRGLTVGSIRCRCVKYVKEFVNYWVLKWFRISMYDKPRLCQSANPAVFNWRSCQDMRWTELADHHVQLEAFILTTLNQLTEASKHWVLSSVCSSGPTIVTHSHIRWVIQTPLKKREADHSQSAWAYLHSPLHLHVSRTGFLTSARKDDCVLPVF